MTILNPQVLEIGSQSLPWRSLLTWWRRAWLSRRRRRSSGWALRWRCAPFAACRRKIRRWFGRIGRGKGPRKLVGEGVKTWAYKSQDAATLICSKQQSKTKMLHQRSPKSANNRKLYIICWYSIFKTHLSPKSLKQIVGINRRSSTFIGPMKTQLTLDIVEMNGFNYWGGNRFVNGGFKKNEQTGIN